MKMTFRNFQHKGFTLIELLIVIAILGTLAGIAFPAYMSVQANAARSAAKKVCTDIVEGCTRFGQDNNGLMPYDPNEVRADNDEQIYLATVAGKDGRMIEILTNREEGDDRINSVRETYLRSDEQEKRADGLYVDDAGNLSFYDPWGQPYYVVLCEEDKGCVDPFVRKKRLRGKHCVAYSTGPDQVGVAGGHAGRGKGASKDDSTVADNVYSWKKEK